MSQYSDKVVADGPAGYWRMNEASGTSFADSSGNGRTATKAGGTINYSATSALNATTGGGAAIEFIAANNAHITASDHDDFSWSQATGLTVEAWVKADAQDSERWVVTKMNSSSNYEWGINRNHTNDGWQGVIFDGAGNNVWTTTGGTAIGTGWYHVVAVFKDNADAECEVYVNGVIDTPYDTDQNDSGTPASSGTAGVRIAARSDTNSNNWDGWIQDVAVYKKVLTATQIAAHYQIGTGGAWVDAPVANVTFTKQDADVVISSDTIIFAEVTTSTWTAVGDVTVTTDWTESAPVANVTFTGISPELAGPEIWELYGQTVVAMPELYLYWRFEETAGTTFQDSGSNNYDGTASTTGMASQDGAISTLASHKAVRTNGTSTYVYRDLDHDLESITLDFWWYCFDTTPSASGDIIFFRNGNTDGFDLRWRGAGAAWAEKHFYLFADVLGSASHHLVWEDPGVEAGWNHLALTLTNTDAELYFNGVEVPLSANQYDTDPGAGTAYGPTTGTGFQGLTKLYLGKSPSTSSYELTQFDELALFDEILTSDEVFGIHAASSLPTSNTQTVNAVVNVTFTPLDASITTGVETVVSVGSPPNISWSTFSPTWSVGDGGVSVGAETANVTHTGIAATVDVVRFISITVDPSNAAWIAYPANVYLNTGDLSFVFVPATDNSFTALDATELSQVDLGSVLYGQEKVIGFRLGNTSQRVTNFEISAQSSNNLEDMVTFSLDRTTYEDTLTIESVPINGVTDTIWVKLNVTTSAYLSEGSFLIHVEQTNA